LDWQLGSLAIDLPESAGGAMMGPFDLSCPGMQALAMTAAYGQHYFQRGLAAFQRIAPQIIAVFAPSTHTRRV